MSLEFAIYSILTSDSDINTVVANRVYPSQQEQEVEYPSITYETFGNESFQSFSGISGLAVRRVQINIWASDFDQLCSLAEQVRLALQTYRGTVATIEIQNVTYENMGDMPFNDEVKVYHRVQEFKIWHTEAQSQS